MVVWTLAVANCLVEYIARGGKAPGEGGSIGGGIEGATSPFTYFVVLCQPALGEGGSVRGRGIELE